MKFILISVMAACIMTMVQTQGIPTKKCPSGEHSVLYCPPKAEPTCAKPYLHDPEFPKPCDIPECFCNTGTIRNTVTKKCVEQKDC